MTNFFKNEDDWFRTKNYLHFDNPITQKDRNDIEKFVSSPEKVASHAFFPFLTFQQKKYKHIEDELGKLIWDRGAVRDLSYAAHLDSMIYSFYNESLTAKYESVLHENGLDNTVIAFRKLKDDEENPKSNIHLARDAFLAIKKLGPCCAFALDIKGFFDNLDPEILLHAWKKILNCEVMPPDHFNVYKSLSKHSTVKKDEVFKLFSISKTKPFANSMRICNGKDFREKVKGDNPKITIDGKVFKGLVELKSKGIPQGSPISATLANIYMIDLDIKISEFVKRYEGFYFRYCDDLLIVIPEKNKSVKVMEFIRSEVGKLKLTLNDSKEKIESFHFKGEKFFSKKPLQYLGFLYDGERIYLRPGSLSRYQRTVKQALTTSLNSMKKHNKIREKKGQVAHPMYRKKIYRKFYHVGNTNFIIYGQNAAEIMKSETIKNQIKRMKTFLEKEISKADKGI